MPSSQAQFQLCATKSQSLLGTFSVQVVQKADDKMGINLQGCYQGNTYVRENGRECRQYWRAIKPWCESDLEKWRKRRFCKSVLDNHGLQGSFDKVFQRVFESKVSIREVPRLPRMALPQDPCQAQLLAGSTNRKYGLSTYVASVHTWQQTSEQGTWGTSQGATSTRNSLIFWQTYQCVLVVNIRMIYK